MAAPARQLDHLNLLSSDVLRDRAFFQEQLGFRLSEHIVMDNGRETGAWLRVTSKSYDLVFTQDATGARGRLHHLAYRLDNREDVLRAADLYTEHGIPIENGPASTRSGRPSSSTSTSRGHPGRAMRRGLPDCRAGLAAGALDRGRARSRPGVGRVDGRELPHVRDARARRAPFCAGGSIIGDTESPILLIRGWPWAYLPSAAPRPTRATSASTRRSSTATFSRTSA
jgi:catechol 2,3-dioxygenase-like lactoylglutathione lyase family enzyme